MKEILINKKWKLLLPEHRTNNPEWWDKWEKERVEATYKAVKSKKNPVLYDIGAEEGDFPALFAKWGARVVLMEPDPLVWPNIKAIFDGNKLEPAGCFVGFASNVTNLKPKQIEGIIDKPDREGWPECSFGPIIKNHGFRNISERTHDTPSITVDDYAHLHALIPDILSIDVEGAEYLVLEGAKKVLSENKVEVFVSIHPEMMFHQYQRYTSDIVGMMGSFGYNWEYIAFDHEFHFHFYK